MYCESPAGGIFRAKQAASFYRERHRWNPLPSRADDKYPLGSYAQYWDTPVASMILDRWDAANVQLMCGVHWGLAVIDLDGASAVAAWDAICLHRPNPRTWTVRTGAGNYHLWYRIPESARELPGRLVWDGGSRHRRIDMLGDRSLVVAPPSRHVRTGRPYEFTVGPSDMAEPATMPGWMVALPDVRRVECVAVPSMAMPAPVPSFNGTFDRRAVLDAIRDKVSLVRAWGLRVIGGRPDRNGWLRCRALGRADMKPSAGFHPRSGYYSEPPAFRLSLFDLAVARGVYPTWVDAVNGLGHRFGVIAS